MTRFSLRWFVVMGFLVAVPAGGGLLALRAVRRADPAVEVVAMVAAGRYRDAQTTLRAALVKTPNDPALHVRMAEVQTRLADPVAAEKEYRRAIALGAVQAPLIPELAEQILLQNRPADVLALVPRSGATPAIAAKNLMLRAVAQLSTGDIRAAEATLATARATVPDAAETALVGARVAAAHNDVAGTEAAVDDVLRRDPNQVEALLMREQLLAAKGDRAGAMLAADHAISVAPWSAMARIDRAYLLMSAGKDAEAQADVTAVLRAQPLFVDAVYLDGVLMARRGQIAEAAARLSRLDGVGPRFPQVLYYQGMIAQRQGQAETAADFARRYASLVPNDPDGLVLLADTAIAIGKPADALPAVRAYLGTTPGSAPVSIALGRLLTASGNPGAAAPVLLAIAETQPQDLPTVGALGLALLGAGQSRAALPLLERAATAQPSLDDLWRGFAQAAIEQRQPEQAAKALDRLRASSGDTADVGNLLGIVRLQGGDAEGAKEAWTAAVSRFPDAASVRLNLARLAVQQGQTAEATNQLGRILSRDPANLPALQSFLALAGDNADQAFPRIEAAHKAQPGNLVFLSLLADARTAERRPQEAVALITQAANGGDTPALLLPALARAQIADGQADDAVASLRAALAANPRDDASAAALLGLLRKQGNGPAATALLEDRVRARPADLASMDALVRQTDAAAGMDAAARVADRLRTDPAHLPYAAVLKGDLMMRHGQPGQAAQAYTEDFKTAPSLVLLLRLAAAEARSGDAAAAADRLRAWLKLNPDSYAATAMLAKLGIAANDFGGAVALLEPLAKARPGDGEALNDLAWCYFKLNDKRARSTAQAAYLASPTPRVADTLGWILVSEGDAAGLPILKRAQAQLPNDPSVAFHLAAALAASGDTKAALPLVDMALAAGDSFMERAEARLLRDKLQAR